MNNRKRNFIIVLGIWLLLSTLAVTFFTFENPSARAALGMVWGVIFFWIVVCGGLMYRFREPIKNLVWKIRLHWQVKFVIFAVLLAILEEAITTAMTNLAPLFGAKIGEVYITASTNFLDVIFFHSVINFIGPFIFWALVLKRYDFSPFSVFLTFGISGVLAEVSFGGLQHLLEFGVWIFVYGLMIFLPVYTLPPAKERGARQPRFYYLLPMILLPALFVPLFAWVPKIINPNHPQPSHFLPLPPILK